MTKGFGAPGAATGSAACPLVAGHRGLVNLTRRQTSESERSWLDQINRDVRLEISRTFGTCAASGEQGACVWKDTRWVPSLPPPSLSPSLKTALVAGNDGGGSGDVARSLMTSFHGSCPLLGTSGHRGGLQALEGHARTSQQGPTPWPAGRPSTDLSPPFLRAEQTEGKPMSGIFPNPSWIFNTGRLINCVK